MRRAAKELAEGVWKFSPASHLEQRCVREQQRFQTAGCAHLHHSAALVLSAQSSGMYL